MPSYTSVAQAPIPELSPGPLAVHAPTHPAPATPAPWRGAGRDRRALSPMKAYGSLERAFAACGLIAACGTTGGAVLVMHGYGPFPLLGATSMAMLLCACLGIRAQERVIQFQRGEVARVYANAVEAPRRAVFDRRRGTPTRMEVLTGAMADMLESLRLTIFGGDSVRLWAVAMRRALDDRAETSKTLAAALGEDAHAIAAAATAARRAESEISADANGLVEHAGRAAEATASVAEDAEALQASVRRTTSQWRQATHLAASLADSAMTARRGVAAIDDMTMALLQAADQVQAVLARAEMLSGQPGGTDVEDMAAELKGLAASGHQALEAMARAVGGLTTQAAAMAQTVTVISEAVQAQSTLGEALGEATSHQMQEAARVAARAGAARGEIVALQQRASTMERYDMGLNASPAARRAVERLPAHAEAVARILRDLPDFQPAKV